MTNNIDERLKRLLNDFDDLLIKVQSIQKYPDIRQTTQNDLVRFFGLTQDEAEGWLKSEPDFIPSDDSYHDSSNRRKVNRTKVRKV